MKINKLDPILVLIIQSFVQTGMLFLEAGHLVTGPFGHRSDIMAKNEARLARAWPKMRVQ